MARKPIDIGAIGNDGTGDSIRDSFRKVNDNFRELYSSLGLGDRLTFRGLDDTPEDYEGQDNAIVSVNSALNDGQGGLVFRQLVPGGGIQINVDNNEIEISSEFAAISADPAPQLGGNLSAQSGGNQYRIQNLTTPISNDEAVNKAYADTKISKAGINAIDPATGTTNSSFGIMSGPLILSRDPETEDDEAYDGLIAATKRYVDNSAFGSVINLYVATSGADDRVGVSQSVQGRALAYAYRTLEGALKRAEEIMLDARKEIGPYKKVLTFNDGAGECTLTDIDIVPDSGSGFTGEVLMSVDTVTVNTVGVNYNIGDIITLTGGTFVEPARYQVLSTTSSPGGVIALRQLSSGVYTALPGSTAVATSNNSPLGAATQGLTLDVTYSVNNVRIPLGGNGSGYGLVSVRIVGGGGTGAFGTADVVGGSIQSITITDGGRGFTSLPNVIVNLPRFLINTDGGRTDFTGDVTTPTPLAARSRDIREGLYLRGETSGALAQILSHSGELDGDDEIFDVDIQFGNFIIGEVIAYGDVARVTQISVLVESGIYEENLPLRVPQNVSIVGDEFRRVIIRPKPGVSSSPWAFLHFRRDTTVDGLTTATQNFGYHYLTDSTEPVYPLVNNKGFYRSAAQLLSLNRQFIQKEVIAWINDQKLNSIAPFSPTFIYNERLCERDIGLLLDSMIFDLKWGGSNRTVSAALKYYSQATDLGDPSIAITEQQDETNAAIKRVNTLAQFVIRNIEITDLYQTDFLQIIDGAFIAETGSGGTSFTITAASNTNPVAITTGSSHSLSNGDQIVISDVEGMTELNGNSYYVEVVNPTTLRLFSDTAILNEVNGTEFGIYTSGGFATNLGGVLGSLFAVVLDIIDPESESINLPKNNNQMDTMLCNDAVRFQAVTFQGHGGFAMVLDPEGQILAKSPYAQECASFSKSTGRQTFAGGMFIDGFAGNLEFEILSKDSDTFLRVGGLKRFPQLPASFIVNDVRYRINYVRDFTFNTAGSTASFVLDETTPWPFAVDSTVYEVLMPGNRSMLGNDYTQINDLGYGLVTTNGGLCEAVSVFSYYCHISLYSLNGGQIRSVSSSSAHGNYALVAEGADPLEIPSPTNLYFDLAQGCTCYFPSGAYANEFEGLVIYVTDYEYAPLNASELEIDHGDGSIYRYPVTSVTTSGLPAGVTRLGLATSTTIGADGLAAVVPNGTLMTIRQNSQIILTGDVVNVATRPSTGLVFSESPDVYRVLQFEEYTDPAGANIATITIGDPTVINKNDHGLLAGYQVSFATTGSLPTGIVTSGIYYVITAGLTTNTFRISASKEGSALVTSGTQSGTQSYTVRGLSKTNLRENYNYVELAVWATQPYRDSGIESCTITIDDPAIVTLVDHNLTAGDVIRFETDGELPTPLITSRQYWVKTVLTGDTFTITDLPLGDAIETTGTQSGTHYVGTVVGRVGDTTFAVVPVGTNDAARVIGSTIVWIGERYTVTDYQDTTETGEDYALLTLDTPLIDSVVNYENLPTLKASGLKGLDGTLTIRISLTRVTGHDLLEIGTGSYADTNYPSEIYGGPVNPINEAAETEERGVGRVFYATTDQYGNFNVGPYFRVDQGTGTVTFAANIALTQLDGLGFKRGVTASEFSIDSTFSDNAPDTIPTENATRGYIEKRLGLSHSGTVIDPENRIPAFSGGFLALNGQLAMAANLNVNNFRVINLADPTDPKDAVNLRSLTFDNISDIEVTNSKSADILTFTGVGNFAQNSSVVGDVSFNIDSTANTVDVQINSGVITNTEVNAAADIVQSKLLMTLAAAAAAAPTGTAAAKQAASGLSSFDTAQFTVTDGFVTVKDNGIAIGKLATITASTVLGNSGLVTATPSAIAFSTVVSSGGAVLKSQYEGTGYLRRIGLTFTETSDYEIVDHATANTVSTLVRRDSNGDFAARNVSVERLLIDTKIALDTTTSATGGYTQVYGFLNNVGILIGDGSLGTDKKSFYDNDSHQFRNYAGSANAPVTMGTLTTPAITTGAAATAGTLTGAWTLQTTSSITFGTGNLTMGSGTLNVSSGTLQSRTLTTGATATVGTITGDWQLASGSKLQATYADLAEYYQGDKDYEVGTVLIFGGEQEVTLSKTAGDHRVAGVVSNNAAYTMNAECQGIKVLIALQGRVPCRVVGKVSKGDLMITSGIAGVAISAKGDARAGTIIGKALQDYDSDHIGTIEVAVGRT